MEQSIAEDRETEWAVRWSPGGLAVETGTEPPWSADYARWVRSPDPVVMRKVRVVRTVVEVDEGAWVEVPA